MYLNTIRGVIVASLLIAPCLWAESGLIDDRETTEVHNDVRDRLNNAQYPNQPVPDPPLPPMAWSQTLAESARAHAEQCVWEHSTNRINVGENLFASTDLSASIDEAVRLWAEEEQYYTFEDSSCDPGQQCGHYTQIVWQSSLLVGCAEAMCSPLRQPDNSTLFDSSVIMVCHYGPAGNLVGAAPYETDGGDESLRASYLGDVGILDLPYLLVRFPDNLVVPYSVVLQQGADEVLLFELEDLERIDYSDRNHVASYDVASMRLYVPFIDSSINGVSGTYSAVLQYLPGTDRIWFRVLTVR